jgi:hypothetical protein
MAVTGIKLVDGAREMVLYPRADINVLRVDAPGPDVRAVTESRTDDDGTVDTTSRHGSRAVSIELQAIANPEAVEDELSAWLHPSLRPYLVVSNDARSQDRRLLLRSESWAPPLSADEPPFYRRILVQWRAPDGAWEAVDETELIISPDIPSRTGRTYPRTYPYSYEPTTASGSPSTVNVGTAPSHFIGRLYGPITAPRLIHVSTGLEIAFKSDLTLGAGEYVEVNTRSKTAFLNGDVQVSRLGHIDFDVNTWWRLQGGSQAIRYTGTDPSGNARAVLFYRPAWM